MKEIEFGELFQKFIEDNLDSKYRFDILLKEIESFQGIPDYIGVSVKDKNACKKFLEDVLDENWYSISKILSNLSHRKGHTISYVAEKTGINISILEKELIFLQNRNLVFQDKYGIYKLQKDFILPNLQIFSFELKIENWKRALFQAIRYKTFSDYSYVVMPKEKQSLLEKNIVIFKQNNIGVAVFDKLNKRIETINRATKNKCISKEHLCYMSGKILFAYQNKQHVSSTIKII